MLEMNNTKNSDAEKQEKLEQLRNILFPEEKSKTVPEFMICPLSKLLMLDPVVVPPGNTYDRQTLLNVVNARGYYDPLTEYFSN